MGFLIGFPTHLQAGGVSPECSIGLRSYKGMSWSNQTMPALVCSSEMLRTLSLGRKQPESPTNLFFVTKAGEPISGFLTEGH